MTVHKLVMCSVRKGLGPEYKEKQVEVYMDDVDDVLPDYVIENMVKLEVKSILKNLGHFDFIIGEIFNA